MSAAIRYNLVSNNLTGEKSFRARILSARTATVEDVVDRIVDQGSTVTRADILGVLEGYRRAIVSLLLEGARVNTPLANFSVSIKGLFGHMEEPFDSALHQLVGKANAGPWLRQEISSRGRAERQSLNSFQPMPVEFLDVGSGEWNSALTPGGIGKLVGSRLKFDPADETQGVFFVAADGTETRVTMVLDNQANKLTFLVPPNLTPGSYRLRMCTGLTENVLYEGTTVVTLTA